MTEPKQYFQGVKMDKLTHGKRLDLLEEDRRSHSKSITSLVEHQALLDKGLKVIEETYAARETEYKVAAARSEERQIATNTRLAGIEKKLEELSGIWTKVVWILATGILGAFAAFILKGGLTL